METEKQYFSSHQMGSYPPIIIGAILGFFPILGFALAAGAIWVSCYSYIYEGTSLYSALQVLLFTMPGACFFCIIGWMFISEGLAQYRFTRDGLSVKYPLQKEFTIPWDTFQQVCVCYAAYTTRGPRRANTILCCVKKGQKKNIYGRWKTDNIFYYRSVICIDYRESLLRGLQDVYPGTVEDLRNTLAYRL